MLGLSAAREGKVVPENTRKRIVRSVFIYSEVTDVVFELGQAPAWNSVRHLVEQVRLDSRRCRGLCWRLNKQEDKK